MVLIEKRTTCCQIFLLRLFDFTKIKDVLSCYHNKNCEKFFFFFFASCNPRGCLYCFLQLKSYHYIIALFFTLLLYGPLSLSLSLHSIYCFANFHIPFINLCVCVSECVLSVSVSSYLFSFWTLK